MPIPDFQQMMLPLLRIAADGREHHTREVTQQLADEFALSEEERKELLPSARQTRLDNRAHWVVAHLYQAKLVERTGRGRFIITDRGRQVLQQNPTAINLRYLSQFPEFVEFRTRRRQADSDEDVIAATNGNLPVGTKTPEEQLEASYENLKSALADELLQRILQSSPEFFERLVVDLLVSMGYGGSRADAGQAIGRSGDNGIDGIIKEDRLGLDALYIQAKRWQYPVGGPVVREFAGSLLGKGARKGVLITTSTFTRDALQFAAANTQQKIVLIDGETLANLMIDFDVAVTPVAEYKVKKIDLDYFGE